jgi:cytochrome oxidase assembly protein ShyY1
MKPATKHWLFLVLLAVTLAALIAFALWQMEKARRERGITKYEIRVTSHLTRMYNV